MTDVAYQLVVTAPGDWLTANQRRDWRQVADLVRQWRESAVLGCRAARLPKGITPVRIHAVCCYGSRRPPVRDRLNLAPTMKAIVDGLTPQRIHMRSTTPGVSVGYGLLPDDSDKHVLATTWTLEPSSQLGKSWVLVVVTHVLPEAA
jgi:hypothetical protein